MDDAWDECHQLQVTVYQKNSADLTKLMMNYEGLNAAHFTVDSLVWDQI